MRGLVSQWLREAGYEVLAQALPRRIEDGPVDLVVLDMVNMRESGRKTVEAVRGLFHGAPIVGTSTQVSCSMPSRAQAVRALGLEILLGKPCSRDELIQSVGALVPPV